MPTPSMTEDEIQKQSIDEIQNTMSLIRKTLFEFDERLKKLENQYTHSNTFEDHLDVIRKLVHNPVVVEEN